MGTLWIWIKVGDALFWIQEWVSGAFSLDAYHHSQPPPPPIVIYLAYTVIDGSLQMIDISRVVNARLVNTLHHWLPYLPPYKINDPSQKAMYTTVIQLGFSQRKGGSRAILETLACLPATTAGYWASQGKVAS